MFTCKSSCILSLWASSSGFTSDNEDERVDAGAGELLKTLTEASRASFSVWRPLYAETTSRIENKLYRN